MYHLYNNIMSKFVTYLQEYNNAIHIFVQWPFEMNCQLEIHSFPLSKNAALLLELVRSCISHHHTQAIFSKELKIMYENIS